MIGKYKMLVNELDKGDHFKSDGAHSIKGRFRTRRGSGNTIVIGNNTKFAGSITFFGNNNTVLIGSNCHYRGDINVKGTGQTVSFGDNSTSVGLYILCQENCDVNIGKWCMFSRAIEVRTTDAHSIIDRETGSRLNSPASITIGDHVWVSLGCIINKGTHISSDSVVGAGSFLNTEFPKEGSLIVGAPGKVIKNGITWNRGRQEHFTPEEMDHWMDDM